MSELWGPTTESYTKVLKARVKFLRNGSFAQLNVAWKLFVEAVRENDVFARFDLSVCLANPMRAVDDIDVSIAPENRPHNYKERAAKGYLLPLLAVSDQERAILWPYFSSTIQGTYNTMIPILWAKATNQAKDSVYCLRLLWLLSTHFYVPAIEKLTEILGKGVPPCTELAHMGRFFQACRDVGRRIEMPLSWHTSDVFQYGLSDFTRFRFHSKSPKLLCVQSDNACRRAVLYWMWAPVPVVKDVKRMIARMVWVTRIHLDTWVRSELISPEKRLKA